MAGTCLFHFPGPGFFVCRNSADPALDSFTGTSDLRIHRRGAGGAGSLGPGERAGPIRLAAQTDGLPWIGAPGPADALVGSTATGSDTGMAIFCPGNPGCFKPGAVGHIDGDAFSTGSRLAGKKCPRSGTLGVGGQWVRLGGGGGIGGNPGAELRFHGGAAVGGSGLCRSLWGIGNQAGKRIGWLAFTGQGHKPDRAEVAGFQLAIYVFE